ncbi:hypothetical protein D3C80_1359170 [compost metagenome]
MLGVHRQQLGIGIAGEAVGLDGGDGRRHVEHLGGLGQRHDVVLQHLAVDRLHAEGHLRLLVDEDQLAVLRGEHFEVLGHGVSPSWDEHRGAADGTVVHAGDTRRTDVRGIGPRLVACGGRQGCRENPWCRFADGSAGRVHQDQLAVLAGGDPNDFLAADGRAIPGLQRNAVDLHLPAGRH